MKVAITFYIKHFILSIPFQKILFFIYKICFPEKQIFVSGDCAVGASEIATLVQWYFAVGEVLSFGRYS